MIIKNEIDNIERFLQDAVNDGSRMAYVRIFRRKVKGKKDWEWCIDAQRIKPNEETKMEGVMGVSSLKPKPFVAALKNEVDRQMDRISKIDAAIKEEDDLADFL